MKERDVVVLSQLLKSLEEALPKLETAYHERDLSKFTNSKKFILKVQEALDKKLK